LVNPRLLLDLPATPGPTHNGGKVAIGPDDNVYLSIGDIGDHDSSDPSTIINIKGGPEPDGRAGILRVTQNGEAVQAVEEQGIEREEEDDSSNSILGDEYPLNLYYAYGIRNSFGMDFDPVTGKLWDVETGRYFGEEINLVEPGFNSGWMKAQGVWELNNMLQAVEIASPGDESFISQLVDFNEKGKYSSPEFTWGKMPVTTSGAAFFHSDRLGEQYENNLFVGEFVNGMIFDFNLSDDRTELSFDNNGPLNDKLADDAQELEEVIFGYGFGGITDIRIGPYDGYMYVLSLDRGGDECKPQYPDRSCIPYSSTVEGHIFRIVPAAT
jgi:glucose/arabinose dehydrogenase